MPDSSSSVPASRFGTATPRSTLNTAAASVDDSTAPQRNATRQSRSSSRCSAVPATAMLTSTDTVDSSDADAERRPHRGPSGGQPALDQDQHERGQPERLGELGVGELEPEHGLAEQQADAEVEHERGQPDANRHPNCQDAQQDDSGDDAEDHLQAHRSPPPCTVSLSRRLSRPFAPG